MESLDLTSYAKTLARSDEHQSDMPPGKRLVLGDRRGMSEVGTGLTLAVFRNGAESGPSQNLDQGLRLTEAVRQRDFERRALAAVLA